MKVYLLIAGTHGEIDRFVGCYSTEQLAKEAQKTDEIENKRRGLSFSYDYSIEEFDLDVEEK